MSFVAIPNSGSHIMPCFPASPVSASQNQLILGVHILVIPEGRVSLGQSDVFSWWDLGYVLRAGVVFLSLHLTRLSTMSVGPFPGGDNWSLCYKDVCQVSVL